MSKGWLVLLLILAFVAFGMLRVYWDAKRPLPKNLPPPLKDDEEEKR